MRTKLLTVLITAALTISLLFAMQVPAVADNKVNHDAAEPQNGIPLVIIRVDESEEAINAAEKASSGKDYGTVAEMNGSEDHSVRCTGTIEIKVPEGFIGEYGSVKVPEGEVALEYIRGRGNSTWDTDPDFKRSYKIKYMEKQNLFGMGKNKEWALMANTFDETLLKNRIVSWLGERMGFVYTPQMIPVDVVMIGSETGTTELGSYCLSELVSTGGSRIDIDGAKLLAYYSDVQKEGAPYFTTDDGIEIMFDDPEEVNEQVEAFINDLEAQIMSSGPINKTAHAAIADKMDLETAADYWWIQEFTCNGDAFRTSSTYMYIDPSSDWKLFWGPLWDFDLTFSDKEDAEGSDTKFGFNNSQKSYFDQLRMNDPRFIELLKERWNGTDDPEDPYPGLNQMLKELTKSGGELDRMKEQIRASWNRDHELWKTAYEDEEELDLDAEIEELRTWIEKRRVWINHNLSQLGKVYYTVTYEADGNVICTGTVRGGEQTDTPPDAPEKDGYLFVFWQERGTGRDNYDIVITQDTVFDAVYVSEKEAVKPAALFFGYTEVWAPLSQGEYDGNWKIIVPEDAVATKATWTSSDESVAAVNKYGCATLLSEGDTTITVTMFNGVSGSYVLHVYDSDKVSPTKASGVAAKPQELTLKVGESRQISCSILPEGGIFEDCYATYESDGSDCIQIEDGVITGVKPGKTTVTVYLTANGNADMFTDHCVVRVIE